MGDETIEKLTRELAETEKNLANSKVEIVELTGKINKMRDVRTIMTHLTDTQKRGGHASFVKTFTEIAPPLNQNYDSFPKVELPIVRKASDPESSDSDSDAETETKDSDNKAPETVLPETAKLEEVRPCEPSVTPQKPVVVAKDVDPRENKAEPL